MFRSNAGLGIWHSQRIFPRRLVPQIVIFFFLVFSNFLPPEGISLALLFLVTIAPIAFGMKAPRGVWHAIWPISIMMLFGLLGSFDKDTNDVIKDVWYFGKAILIVIFGYLAMWRIQNIKTVLRLFVLAAVIVSGLHLTKVGMDLFILMEHIYVIHQKIGAGYMISALGVVILLAALKYHLDLFPFRSRFFSWIALMVCLLSVIISFSRTLWICIFISGMLLLYKTKSKKLNSLALAGLLVTVLLFLVSGVASTLQGREDAFGFMMGKITHSLEELIVSDYSGVGNINLHWRAIESYQALQTYKSGGIFDYLFGQGFGANIDLGFFMTLQEINMQYIPIVHNGFLYILVKTGFIGLFLYLYYLILLFRYGLRSSQSGRLDVRCSGFLLMAVALLFFTTTYIITGMFNKHALFPATLLLGILLYHLRNVAREFISKS